MLTVALLENGGRQQPPVLEFQTFRPGGSYGAEDSLAFLNRWQGRYAKVFAASDELLGLLYKRYQAEQDKEKP